MSCRFLQGKAMVLMNLEDNSNQLGMVRLCMFEYYQDIGHLYLFHFNTQHRFEHQQDCSQGISVHNKDILLYRLSILQLHQQNILQERMHSKFTKPSLQGQQSSSSPSNTLYKRFFQFQHKLFLQQLHLETLSLEGNSSSLGI